MSVCCGTERERVCVCMCVCVCVCVCVCAHVFAWKKERKLFSDQSVDSDFFLTPRKEEEEEEGKNQTENALTVNIVATVQGYCRFVVVFSDQCI